jgi:hypothetical protein
MSGLISKKDWLLVKRIEEKIKQIKAKLILVPYGVGGHVDHVMVKKAAETTKNKNYYLESPYLWQNFNYIKYLGKIIGAGSVKRGKETKKVVLKKYRSQYNLLVKDNRMFTEIII